MYLNDRVYGTDLDAAFSAVGTGDTIFLTPGTYNVTTLALNNKSDITIEGSGMGKTILKDTDGSYLLNLNSGDCTGITVKNLTLDGDGQSSVLIKVGTGADCSDLNIENVEFKDATHGINIASADTDAGSALISITGSSFHDLAYAGIYAERGDISVANSSFEDIRSADGTAAGILFATGVNSDPYSLSVTESDFKNITGTDASNKATGAVSVTGSGTLESFVLTGNAFEGNTYDLHLGKVDSTPSIESMTMENNGDINVYIPKEDAQIYTATFVSEGVVLETKIADSTGKVTVPAAPIRTGYKFLGWNDGTDTYNASVSVTISEDTTFTAQWQQIPTTPDTPSYDSGSSEPSGDYIVSVDRVSGGKVTVNPGRADKGDEVTVTVKPNDGYDLDELVVTDSKGNELELSYEGSGKYTFTMPSGTVDVKATFVKADVGSVLDDFTDVNPDAWYAQAVEFVVEEGLMTGTSATTFAPDTSMSRAMIWTVLAAYNSYNTSGGNPWYAPGQQWAMVNGVSDGTAPNSSITREQLAVMLWRAAGSPETSESLSGYADASSVSDWAVEALAWAVDNGIISGMGGSTLAPQATATRAQVAVMLMQFVDYMEA